MTPEDAFLQLFKKLMPKAAMVSVGKATNIDKEKRVCDVERDGQPILFNCRLNAVVDSMNSYSVVFPKPDSYVLCLTIGDTDNLVIAYSEIQEINVKIENTTMVMNGEDTVFNGGKLGGMVKISELTNKINDFVKIFNSHTHPVSTTGTASAQTGAASATISQASFFSKSDYENTKIKQ
ncbi:hypothetical protein [Dysgonomonas sp. 520]|uniref:hypothetical protein n=1 Tax=Dysgonomonas sp. 520 TaxID=2302931 RepID=UPI0013D399E8|nr:hypothetical protein [Dysgonomonas sp. 520]NDW10952.1 hypothetical protein [Dysgonomonas sp. 520]